MKRMLTRLFLPELLLTGLLTGCACGMVEDIVPEEARLVEVGFVKPDLGIPAVLTRAEDTEVPAPTPLPEGSTVRIVAYYRSSIGVEASPVPFSTTTPTVEATYKVMADGSLALCSVDDTGKPVPVYGERAARRNFGFVRRRDDERAERTHLFFQQPAGVAERVVAL